MTNLGFAQEDLDLRAQVTFMHRALRAVVRSHPDPLALREVWLEESSEALAHLGIQQVGLAAPNDVTDAFQKAYWQWSGIIAEGTNRANP